MSLKEELVLVLEGGGPKTLPLARIAAYMTEFAAMLGEQDEVFFSDVRDKCTAIVAAPRRGGTLTRAKNRAYRLASHDGPAEALKAFETIADMAREDRRPARVLHNASVILHFPKQPRQEPAPLRIRDAGQVTGELSAMIRTKGAIRARIRPIDGGRYIDCTASDEVAREMRVHLLEVVRVSGVGWWHRSDDGWICDSLEIRTIRPVEVVNLREAVDRLREADIDWPDDPLESLAALG